MCDKWIEFKPDNLPALGVLDYDVNGWDCRDSGELLFTDGKRINIGHLRLTYYKDGSVDYDWYVSEWDDISVPNINHWMPLPELPK
jgi:hypothetical protein